MLTRAQLPGRTQFKHVAFAPQLDSPFEEEIFPGIRDAIHTDDWERARTMVDRAADIIKNAAKQLIRS